MKDSKRFAKTNGWGFFNFGHHPWPYEESAAEASVAECAGCHIANVAKTDMTWIQFYPLLRDRGSDAPGKRVWGIATEISVSVGAKKSDSISKEKISKEQGRK